MIDEIIEEELELNSSDESVSLSENSPKLTQEELCIKQKESSNLVSDG